MNDSFGDRIKIYEGVESDRILIPNLPILVRLDGKSFHNYCKRMVRPFDSKFHDLMDQTAIFMLEQTNAVVSYVQSDEISLIIWNYNRPDSQVMFNGRIQKLTSVLVSMATAFFNSKAVEYFPDKPLAFFDCRVFNVPTSEEAVNCILWRELDASRNSIQAVAQSLYSPKQLHGKNTSQLHDLLHAKGINWNNFADREKRGSYFKSKRVIRQLTAKELQDLPEHHEARKDPNKLVIRHKTSRLDIPPLLKIANRHDVIIYDSLPILKDSAET